MKKRAVALRHVAFENLGGFEPLIKKKYDLRYVEVPTSSLKDIEADLLIILGGPIGVYQEDAYPFIKEELALIKKHITKPLLGICLGSQLIARALGSKVYPNHTKEIGWIPLTLTEEGLNSPIAPFKDAPMFHWHGDTFDLPQGAKLLASTPNCENQIYTLDKILAFQCHPEVIGEQLESWWVGHAAELDQNKLSVTKLREQTKQHSQAHQSAGTKCLENWLKSL